MVVVGGQGGCVEVYGGGRGGKVWATMTVPRRGAGKVSWSAGPQWLVLQLGAGMSEVEDGRWKGRNKNDASHKFMVII